MKRYYKTILLCGAVALLSTACTEDPDTEFIAKKPESLANYEYLNNYAPLKAYAPKGFKVGAAVDAAEYNKRSEVYALANGNFNEVVATYHMKHGGVVRDNGTMDFKTVNEFIYGAQKSGLSVFGHVLCWHNGQNVKYLNSLLEDKLVPDDPAAAGATLHSSSRVLSNYVTRVTRSESETWGDNILTNCDFEGEWPEGISAWNNSDGSSTASVEAGVGYDGSKCYKLVNTTAAVAGNNWHSQFMIDGGVEFEDGEVWKLSFKIKSDNGSTISGGELRNVSESKVADCSDITTSSQWSDVSMTFNIDANSAGGKKFIFSFAELVDAFYIDNIELRKQTSSGGGSSTDTWESMSLESDFDISKNWNTFAIHGYKDPETAEVVTEGDNKYLKFTNADGGDWGPQLVAMAGYGNAFAAGEVWKVTFKVKGDADYADAITGICVQDKDGKELPAGATHYYSNMSITSEWKEVELNINVDSDSVVGGNRVVFNFNGASGTFCVDDLEVLRKVTEDEPDVPTVNYQWGNEMLTGGDLEGITLAAGATEYETENLMLQGQSPATVTVATGYDTESKAEGGESICISFASALTNKWDAQVLITPNVGAFAADDVYQVSFDVKSENGTAISSAFAQTATYQEPYSYGKVATTAGAWMHYDIVFTGATDADKFAMQFGDAPDTYYFDNISMKKGRIKPDGFHYEILTPEEKSEVITEEMKRWVEAMIKETKGKVNVWDVVNEAINDADPTTLRSAEDADPLAAEHFYWADYMGKDFVRDVIKMARDAAGEEELTLFINDYCLELPYAGSGQNEKCEALIDWIKYWEEDGVTKIDGIGTQMHIDLSLDPTYQAKQEAGVVKMLELLAATGKLIRISEIDMGVALGANEWQMSTMMSEEQHKAMADYYQFIVEKYFEIIPKEQQFGIAHWSPIDAANTAGVWKQGQPVGLWNLDLNRKHTYAGFARGLSSGK